jgi:demethoxyubiquinone hydroxylase (CLK1/Coq7/Cat5 family)
MCREHALLVAGARDRRFENRIECRDNAPLAAASAHRHAFRIGRAPRLSRRNPNRTGDELMGDMQKHNVEQLNSFLRGEISAVETYRQALDSLKTPSCTTQLAECKRSHEERVAILTEEIRKLGGTPAQSSGPWGTFAKLVEGGASALGEKAAVAALEEGEDHGNADYKRDVKKLDGSVRSIIEEKVVPLQLRSHGAMSSLKKRLS